MKMSFVRAKTAKAAGGIALALIALASVVTGREKPVLEIVEPKSASRDAAAVAPVDIDLEKLQRSAPASAGTDPFAPRSFAQRPAPRQAQAAPAPAQPSTPPLPFTYIGRLTQDGKTEVFVLRGDELISLAAGQTIDGQYHVDAVSEARIIFTYLPLKTRQSIELGEAGA
jgi:hypothetical protein